MSSFGGEVKEGFLCPICMTDLGDVIQLKVHFEEKHAKEDPVFIQNLKDLYGKAKKKILQHDPAATTGAPNDDLSRLASDLGQEAKATLFGSTAVKEDFDPVSGVHRHLLAEPTSEPRYLADHTDFFRGERQKRLERNKSTNQLLIRLEKLLRHLPSEPSARRLHEQAVVPWIDEKLVKMCPSCAKSFNIVARRKHHCRLCGGIMCSECSTFVDLSFARKVVNPATISRYQPQDADDDDGEQDSSFLQHQESPSKLLGMFRTPKKMAGSQESLNSISSEMKAGGGADQQQQQQLRLCQLCRDILETQAAKVELAVHEPVLVQFYRRLQQHMHEGGVMSQQYLAMTESLSHGEEDYSLQETTSLRMKLLKIAENVDVMSKRIASLEVSGPSSQMEATLQQRIRQASVIYVKETLVGLPSVPSEEQYEKLKRKKIEEAERRVREEKQAAKLAKLKYEQEELKKTPGKMTAAVVSPMARDREKSTTGKLAEGSSFVGNNHNIRSVQYGSGFVLTTSNTCSYQQSVSDDPMVQQIHNIRNYISEAKRMGKYDEVQSLEANLRDLQLEYQKMQQQEEQEQKELEENYNSFKGMFHLDTPEKEKKEKELVTGEQLDATGLSEQDAADLDEYDASGKNPFF